MEYVIRAATIKDLPAIQAIYAYYVEQTTISFDYSVPSVETMKSDMQHIMTRKLPYLVAENCHTHQLLGFAYAAPFSTKQGYDFTCTLSIYVASNAVAKGIGQHLYEALEASLIVNGIVQIVAMITSDNFNSLNFHERNGFVKMGEFPNAGYKFNQWHSMCWLIKTINSHKLT